MFHPNDKEECFVIRESTLRFKSGKQRIVSYFGRATINLAPCGNVTVLGVLQTEQVTLTFVSGIWAEGSVMLETLKVFMQFFAVVESFHRSTLLRWMFALHSSRFSNWSDRGG